MSELWNDLLHTLQIEMDHLERLKKNLLRQQDFIMMNQSSLLKESLEQEKEILYKNFQVEQYRIQLMNQMKDAGMIPSKDLSIDQLSESVPESIQSEFLSLKNKIKAAAFELEEINTRNRLMINRALNWVNEEFKILTQNPERATYHQKGDWVDQQRLSLFNRQV
ncbi:MAG: flagellar export chaperone FlgN [Candidatus Delongbacteria bacterium]|nr:flagellar export chaperone FlgN [Candidatus Delongbacteria bacterium]